MWEDIVLVVKQLVIGTLCQKNYINCKRVITFKTQTADYQSHVVEL